MAKKDAPKPELDKPTQAKRVPAKKKSARTSAKSVAKSAMKSSGRMAGKKAGKAKLAKTKHASPKTTAKIKTKATKQTPKPLWLRVVLVPLYVVGYILYGIWLVVRFIAMLVLAVAWLCLRYVVRYGVIRPAALIAKIAKSAPIIAKPIAKHIVHNRQYWGGGLALAVLVLGVWFGSVAVWQYGVVGRASHIPAEQTLHIETGDSQRSISQQLNVMGLSHPYVLYRLEAWRRGGGYVPKAGEYALPEKASLSEAMDIIHDGVSRQYDITIAEGLTSAEVVALIMADDRWTGEIVTAPPEGSLLPQTYHFPRATTRATIIKRMQQARDAAFRELWEIRDPDVPLANFEEAVVLASLIEKETGIDEERGLVASVFVNRLWRGMRLESDPTVLYGLIQEGHPANISLGGRTRHNSDWNTYVIDGLPPTPIANPGLASFAAAVNPPASEYLYFVADGNGGHSFSASYEEHNAKVEALRKKNAQ